MRETKKTIETETAIACLRFALFDLESADREKIIKRFISVLPREEKKDD